MNPGGATWRLHSGCTGVKLGMPLGYRDILGISLGYLWDILEIFWDHYEKGTLNLMVGVIWRLILAALLVTSLRYQDILGITVGYFGVIIR